MQIYSVLYNVIVTHCKWAVIVSFIFARLDSFLVLDVRIALIFLLVFVPNWTLPILLPKLDLCLVIKCRFSLYSNSADIVLNYKYIHLVILDNVINHQLYRNSFSKKVFYSIKYWKLDLDFTTLMSEYRMNDNLVLLTSGSEPE